MRQLYYTYLLKALFLLSEALVLVLPVALLQLIKGTRKGISFGIMSKAGLSTQVAWRNDSIRSFLDNTREATDIITLSHIPQHKTEGTNWRKRGCINTSRLYKLSHFSCAVCGLTPPTLVEQRSEILFSGFFETTVLVRVQFVLKRRLNQFVAVYYCYRVWKPICFATL